MKRAFCAFVLFALVTCAQAQRGETTFVTGAAIEGGKPCGVFVTHVSQGSPADLAGVKSGDVLLAVDGATVSTVDDAAVLLRSDAPQPVTLLLLAGEQRKSVIVGREKLSVMLGRHGEKLLENGMIVPLDATEEEFQGKLKTLTVDRFAARVFPTHYPENTDLYYAGFEIVVLRDPAQIAVLGIEDGPAAQSGVHWGDVILAVNGIDPGEKSVAQLEALFSSNAPKEMALKVDRNGVLKTFSFRLKKTSEVLRENGQQFVGGKLLPLGIREKYLDCFK